MMHSGSTAFVSGIPVFASGSSRFTVSPLQTQNFVSAPKVNRQAASVYMNSNGEKPNLPKVPQGFTPFSEELNGRAAMLGFVLAMVTEVLNPSHPGIAAQVGSILEVLNIAKASTM